MAIAGTVIIINSNNEKANEVALAVRDLEKNKAYYHVGFSILKNHIAPSQCSDVDPYVVALYGAISGTARCGADVISDLTITQASSFKVLATFISDFDVVWVNIGVETNFVTANLSLAEEIDTLKIAKEILAYMSTRYKYVTAYARYVPEVSPVPMAKTPGKIVLLIGASSAGKSTLSKSIQENASDIFLHVGIDTAVLHYVPLRYLSGVPKDDNDQSWREPNYNPTEYNKVGYSWIAPGPTAENPFPHLRFQVGAEGRRGFSAMYASIAEMSRLGFNVISDHCFHFENALFEARHRFQGLPVVYVKLCPTLEIIRKREEQRGDRMEGMGESVYYQMINDYDADITLDTGVYTPADGAKQVLDFIDTMSI